MMKLKAIPFILVGTICHLALWALLIARYIDCLGDSVCVGFGAKVGGYVLGFPIELISWIWEPSDPHHPMQSSHVILLPINSILAVSIFYLIVSFYFKHRQAKNVTKQKG
jgi:hypothetical protein